MIQNSDSCSFTGKRRFTKKGQAERAIRQFKERSRRQRIPKRSYYCKECHGWHLTSEPKHELE